LPHTDRVVRHHGRKLRNWCLPASFIGRHTKVISSHSMWVHDPSWKGISRLWSRATVGSSVGSRRSCRRERAECAIRSFARGKKRRERVAIPGVLWQIQRLGRQNRRGSAK
jgi:hypothetical protein